jgi:glutathione-regulated potassium-efflux system ancillary protein KefG
MPAKPSILILLSHPYPRQSQINRALVDRVRDLPNVTVHDLYACYPDFHIDPKQEQDLLRRNVVIVLQHPMHWYHAPALTQEWFDVVLVHGFAYGEENTSCLDGKDLMVATSTGGPESSYRRDGANRFTMDEFLRPFEQTAHLCRMVYRPPFVIHGANTLAPEAIAAAADRYRTLLDDYPYQPGNRV